MAIPFLTSINLRGNETQNHVLHLTSSDPSTYVSAAGGNIYYNTGTDKIKYYDSATWQTVASEAWANAKFVDSVTSGDTNTITIGGTAADPTISANTAAVTNGSLNLATGDQIYDFVIGLGYSTTTGTVTSVAISGTDGIDVDSGSPITTSGTITLGLSNVPNTSLANSSITIGDSTIALGGTDTTLTGLTDIDLTAASHTIFDNVGANNLTIGAGTTTVIIPGDLQVTGTVTTNNVETVSTSNGVIFEGNVADANELTLLAGTLTADRTVTLPDADGTVALTSDISDDTITITAGNGLVTGGTFTLNGTATTITIDHEDTSSQASVNNSGQTVIQDVTLDDYGHVTALTSVDLSSAFDTAGKITKKISGDGLTTDFTVTHSFGTPIVSVQVLDYGDNGTGATYEVVYTDIERSDDNNITVGFATAPSGTEDYLVLISKFPAIS